MDKEDSSSSSFLSDPSLSVHACAVVPLQPTDEFACTKQYLYSSGLNGDHQTPKPNRVTNV